MSNETNNILTNLFFKHSSNKQQEVACIDLTNQHNTNEKADLLCVGMWKDNTVRLYCLPDLKLLETVSQNFQEQIQDFFCFSVQFFVVVNEGNCKNQLNLIMFQQVSLGEGIIPRSVVVTRLDNTCYLLVGMGDGQLFTFVVGEGISGTLSNRKKLSLGTQPITLTRFRFRFFACFCVEQKESSAKKGMK